MLTAEGAKEEDEQGCRKPAAVILIACLPPGYGSEKEAGIIKKNAVEKAVQCGHVVLVLSGSARMK